VKKIEGKVYKNVSGVICMANNNFLIDKIVKL